MTPMAKYVLSTYSLIAILMLMILSFRKIEKDEKGGWAVVALIPVLIYLINLA
jgi:hypothetical protein